MNASPLRTWLPLAVSLLLLAAIRAVTIGWPPDQSVSTPELEVLRARRTKLAGATEQRRQEAEEHERRLRGHLWTSDTLAYWRKNSLPPGWTMQDLGPAEMKHAPARRFALQRPGATGAQWQEITALLAELESRGCTRVQGVTLSTKPGYLGSRNFSQCVIVVLLHFAADPPPGS